MRGKRGGLLIRIGLLVRCELDPYPMSSTKKNWFIFGWILTEC